MGHVPTDVAAWLLALAKNPRIPAVIVEHLSACRDRGLTPSTLTTTLTVLRRIDDQLAQGGAAGLLEADEGAVRAWWRRPHGLAEATRARNLSLLRAFYRWAVREDLRRDDPTWRLDGPRLGVRLPRPADLDEVRDLLARLEGGRDWLPVALAAYCGLRCAEIAALRCGDLSTDELGHALLIRGKRKTERRVPAPRAVAYAVLGQNPRWAAVRTPAGTPYTAAALSRRIGQILAAGGLAVSAHQLRHLYATRVYRDSGDLLATARALGHRSLNTTAIYAQSDPASLRHTAEQVWSDLTSSQVEKPETPVDAQEGTA